MEEIQKFKDAISPFLPTWKVMEIRAVADLDSGTLISMVSCFSPDDPKPLEIIGPIQGIIFIRATLPILDFNRILEEWEKGAITFGSYQLSTSDFSNVRFVGLSSDNEDLTLGWPDFRMYRQFLLQSYGIRNIEAIVKPKDVWAIARVLGFMGFDELSLNRVQFRVGGSRVTRMEIFAPVFAVIETKTEADKLHIKIKTHEALQPEALILSYRIQDQKSDRLGGGSVLASEFKKTTSGYFNILEYSLTLPASSISGEVFLYHKLYKSQGEPISTAFFTVQPAAGTTNPRWDLILSIVENTRKWTKMGTSPEEVIKQWLGLSQPRPQQDDFETGVSALFFGAGITSLAIGDAEGVDNLVLVNEPHQNAVVISCTTSADIGNKINGLLIQCNRVKVKLPNYSVHAVIIAPIETDDLRLGDLKDCEARDICLLLRSELQTLFEQVRGINWNQTQYILVQMLTLPINRSTIFSGSRM